MPTIGPISVTNPDDGCQGGSSWAEDGFSNQNWLDSGDTNVGLSFVLPSGIPANATITKAYVRMKCGITAGGAVVFKALVEDVDSTSAALWSASHLPSNIVPIRANGNESESFAESTFYFGEGYTNPINFAQDVQDLITKYGAMATGERINFAFLWQSGSGSNYTAFYDKVAAQAGDEAQLTIEYTEGGADADITPPLGAASIAGKVTIQGRGIVVPPAIYQG